MWISFELAFDVLNIASGFLVKTVKAGQKWCWCKILGVFCASTRAKKWEYIEVPNSPLISCCDKFSSWIILLVIDLSKSGVWEKIESWSTFATLETWRMKKFRIFANAGLRIFAYKFSWPKFESGSNCSGNFAYLSGLSSLEARNTFALKGVDWRYQG